MGTTTYEFNRTVKDLRCFWEAVTFGTLPHAIGSGASRARVLVALSRDSSFLYFKVLYGLGYPRQPPLS